MFNQLILADSLFGPLDWAVLAAYLLLLLGSGIWFARREPTGAKEYFLAGRRMPTWAVAFSIIASTLSVATFTGVPELAFNGDLTYLSTNIGGLIAVAVVATFFIPAFYRLNVTTVYELLERRFGTGAKHAASAAFMVGRTLASGSRVYIAAIPLAMLIFGIEGAENTRALIGAIAILSFVAVAYTLIGGIASVIWTDVIQTIVLIGSVIAGIAVMLHKIPAPISDIVSALQTAGDGGTSKLRVINWGVPFDPAASFTIFTAVLGFSLTNMASLGTDHDMVQRMLTCKTPLQGSRSVVAAIFMGIPIVALFLVVGLLLFVFYRRPDLMGAAAPTYSFLSSERIFMNFILREFPPGLSGVMVAGLFACGLGSLNSAINAMAATFVSDFYKPWRIRTGRTAGQSTAEIDAHDLRVSRWATIGWGLMLALFAVLCIFWKQANQTGLIELALTVMNFAYSGLLAVFLCALFTRRGSTASCIAALLTGFTVVLLMQSWAIALWSPLFWPATSGPADTKPFTLAFPWQMLIATSAAFAVCCIGNRPAPADPSLSPA